MGFTDEDHLGAAGMIEHDLLIDIDTGWQVKNISDNRFAIRRIGELRVAQILCGWLAADK